LIWLTIFGQFLEVKKK